jgi:6,7-dimethyl-8-ribityllumazine synthase
MSTSLAGSLRGEGHRIAIAAARFNHQIVEQLVGGAIDGLVRHGVSDKSITVVRCPGSWELPLVCRRLADSEKFDAIIACGAVIRGDTPHFDYVAGEAAKGLAGVQQHTGLPIVFAVLTTDTVEQAQARAGGKAGNKGFDAAMTAIEMINLLKSLGS